MGPPEESKMNRVLSYFPRIVNFFARKSNPQGKENQTPNHFEFNVIKIEVR
jgi:hypothetical protein